MTISESKHTATMQTFDFTFTLSIADYLSHDELDELCGKVLATGCDDASLHTSGKAVYMSFHREGEEQEDAISSALKAVRKAGYSVTKIEIDRP